MRRRMFLSAGAAGLGGLTAGCVSGAPRAAGPARATDREDGSADLRRAAYGTPPDICEKPIRPDSGIDAIVDPAFDVDWRGLDVGIAYQHYRQGPRLQADQPVIGLSWEGGARAYPLSVLVHHEVVNDTTAEPVLVTYCPLCASGMVASRVVDGRETRFAVTGQLWKPEGVYAAASKDAGRSFGASYGGGESVAIKSNGNLVLYDAATHSYWSQILAHAICGPLTDTDLAIRPSTVATWREWRTAHPGTEVLLPPPYSKTVEPGVVLGGG